MCNDPRHDIDSEGGPSAARSLEEAMVLTDWALRICLPRLRRLAATYHDTDRLGRWYSQELLLISLPKDDVSSRAGRTKARCQPRPPPFQEGAKRHRDRPLT